VMPKHVSETKSWTGGCRVSTVSNIKDGFEVAMELANAANRSGDVAKLIVTQQQVLDVLDANRQLRDQVAALEDELAMESQLVRRGFTYHVREQDDSLTGPVCPGCYKRDRVVAQIIDTGALGHFCARCEERYEL